jgi:diguanylate cyclase (GGDEF)-like protein
MKNFTYTFGDIEELHKQLDPAICDSSQLLIQLFCSSVDSLKIKTYQNYVKSYFQSASLLGVTTDGIIKEKEIFTDERNVITFTLFEKTHITAISLEHKNHFNNSHQSGRFLAGKIVDENTKVILGFSDGLNTNGEEFVKGINEIAPNIVLSGGMAADNGKLEQTYVFDKEHIISDGAIAVALSSQELNVTTSYTFDWLPIGKEMQVTKSIKNRVYEIDGLTAVEIYAKYMGQDLAEQLPQVGIEFPLIFERDGIPIGRAALFKHDDGSLTFAGNIQEGVKVRLGVGSIDTILKNSDFHTRKMLDSMKYKSEAVFVYSCMARRRFMNQYIYDELDMLSNLGKTSGFFTYGEFFHSKKSNQLLNETMTILSLSENSNLAYDALKEDIKEVKHFGVDTQHVLAHLANTVSKELADLNYNLERRIAENSNYIYKQAFYDKLTALPNRESLIKRLSSSLGKMIVLINIDDFTTINDFYGHEVGDTVLKRLAFILQDVTKEENAEVFKLPSDEFAIIVEMSPAKQVTMEERIKHYIHSIEKEDFLVSNGHYAHVSVTIAAALINENKTGLVNADMALKLAKKASLDYMIFNEDLQLARQYEENIKMANNIKNALSKDRIVPYFQPIFDLKTGKIDKYEALVRLIEEDESILTPYFFLETSHKIKLYPHITKTMIEKTFAHFKRTGMNFSINLSFDDILNKKTSEFLFQKIEESGIASQLTIEILETLENDNDIAVNQFIQRVYESGAIIAIDDFGSGFANFQHMTTMRSDIMKIDGSLIKNIATDKNARLIVETIIIFAQKLNKKIIAEFVHSKEVYDIVKELGIDYAQGYYLGKPLDHTL